CHPFDKDMINCTQKCNRGVEPCGHPCIEVCCDPRKCLFCGYNGGGQPSERAGSDLYYWHAYANEGGVLADDAEYWRKLREVNSAFAEQTPTASQGKGDLAESSTRLIDVPSIEATPSQHSNLATNMNLLD